MYLSTDLITSGVRGVRAATSSLESSCGSRLPLISSSSSSLLLSSSSCFISCCAAAKSASPSAACHCIFFSACIPHTSYTPHTRRESYTTMQDSPACLLSSTAHTAYTATASSKIICTRPQRATLAHGKNYCWVQISLQALRGFLLGTLRPDMRQCKPRHSSWCVHALESRRTQAATLLVSCFELHSA